jgi:hypothetical protein
MTSDELLPLLFESVPDQERSIVLERLTESKRKWVRDNPESGLAEATTTADSPVPFSVHQFLFDLHIAVYATYTSQGTAQNEQLAHMSCKEEIRKKREMRCELFPRNSDRTPKRQESIRFISRTWY